MPAALPPLVDDGPPADAHPAGSRRGAAEHLFRRYAPRLRAVARAKLGPGLSRLIDPDDVVQSVFRRFLRSARAGRYAPPPGGSLCDLLAVMTRNLLRSEGQFHRAGRRDLRRTVGWAGAEPAGPGGRDALQGLAVDDALRRLPDACREVVRLRLDGYEVAEIAARTGRSKRTVERALGESRARLRSLLHLES